MGPSKNTDRFAKAAFAEKVTEVNSVTLRSYRRRGLLSAIGFEADGKMARYSIVDMVIFRTAVEIERAYHVESTAALNVATSLREVVTEVTEDILSPEEWCGWVAYAHLGSGIQILRKTDDISDPHFINGLIGRRAVIILDIAEIGRAVFTRCKIIAQGGSV